ncbi:hypothetical protein GCM10009127_17090 [Alteraurantiacibacter aestuarii]|uniref:DUF3857 domain-containing protein n=1 Tax=Alteraurantiacibacter aestuarii TaxID=650004 RepID=A0A844ZIT3_9SPHN|nr:DUF3857 domain-containing protein [Alteraurantiacibacter aestuarii]MXO87705.1 DUF3857 domain-containing protein [Alteraurantiacibacter aestuarii]
MKSLRAALFCSAVIMAAPAYAGDEVLYGDVPDWVDQADFDMALEENGPPELLYDWQHRIEGGVVHAYTDHAVRIENPQALMQQGTLTFQWMPDKGDITIHRLEIHRDGTVLDLVGQGVTFDVLRREQGLEQRLLDGALTATLAVPGLREGDVLRIAYTITTDDQALGEDVQVTQFLPSAPWQVGMARAIVSWPKDEDIYFRAEDRINLGEPFERGDYLVLDIDLPLSQRDPVPRDAPTRYRRPEVLRVGSFASWQDLSAVMTPHFEEAARLEPGSAVARQAADIMARTSDPLERMALAVRLVQDEVSYLLDGLDGGNYLPQAAEDTWEKRYGDCKAKSVLLLSLLREMGITSEVVLVTTQGGDAIPELLPLPAAFNHMIVHAELNGTDYWLDGTSAATRLANIADVPPFFYALPLREGGSGLMPMEQRDLASPQMIMTMNVDHSAGADFPVLFTGDMRIFGPGGVPLRAIVDADSPEVLRQLAARFGPGNGLEGVRISAIDVTYDAEKAIGTVHLEGVASTLFEWRDGRMEMDVTSGIDPSGFNPDRARPSWREIPVATPGPGRQRFETNLTLPDGGAGYSLTGDAQMDSGFGNLRITRDARIEDGVLHVQAENFLALGEIPASELGAAKRAARRLESDIVSLATPTQVTWRWDLSEEERRRRAAPILAAYEAAIDFADKDDYGPLQARAMFLMNIYEFEQALADFDLLVEETPSAWALHNRSSVLEALGRREEAIADLQAAYDLDPQNGTAFSLARMMAYDGHTAEANELLEFLPVGEEDRLSLTDVMATVSGLDGDVESGLSLIADEVADKPTNGTALNADCWYRGLFNVALDDAVDQCTRAVERSSNSAPALDSRALVRFRLGDLQQAIDDLDAALEVAPGLAPSMYLRGVVRLTAGDEDGSNDITTALRMLPQLAEFYARHGVIPPR